MFIRRLGQKGVQQCSGGHNCSQVLEMTDGHYAVVGEDIRTPAIKEMPPGPGVGPTEGVVKVPNEVMLAAALEIVARHCKAAA
ncbi:MAG TPA: hypothetical protein VEC99_10955 [Clostridia bacterium]|nr:hypothetical protein [Clostridia bacterium]